MTLKEQRAALLAELAAIPNRQERFALVIERGRRLPALDAASKTDANRIEGCLSKLWFVPEFRDGHCHFRCDSDSAVVRGIAGLLCEFYSGHAPGEIIGVDPSFLAEAGITQHLTPNRRNGLARLWETIRQFASGHVRTHAT